MRDLEDEIFAYLHNRRISWSLGETGFRPGSDRLRAVLRKAYEILVNLGCLPAGKRDLVAR